MKKLSILPLLAVLALFATLSSFKAGAPQTEDEETRNVAPFRKIGLAYPANVILRQGNTQSLRIEGNKEQMSQLDLKVESGRLIINKKRRVQGK
ncbi:hypothetical protein EFA69_03020 [Rufibacter immobilis]|uniref:Putative auto-transporter adhesin head GIN domain-containing protein n=1 Tax=Rufibacter immobilis TaxID=1348778 RepID=A0A3M9N3D0_9BACT|nr:DUF2807 domain-containing protein [Rufibacter immobilis]RNI32311.1 hypothetical protein EFA69_03020 [Rufibacter immobilis]